MSNGPVWVWPDWPVYGLDAPDLIPVFGGIDAEVGSPIVGITVLYETDKQTERSLVLTYEMDEGIAQFPPHLGKTTQLDRGVRRAAVLMAAVQAQVSPETVLDLEQSIDDNTLTVVLSVDAELIDFIRVDTTEGILLGGSVPSGYIVGVFLGPAVRVELRVRTVHPVDEFQLPDHVVMN